MLNESEIVNKIANYIGVDLTNIESKKLDEDNTIYIWENIRGGRHFIVSKDNSFLGASSAISFEKLLEEFKNGKRNGNLETTHTNLNIEQDLKKIIEDVIGNNDPYWNAPVYEIIKKIINLPDGTETSIPKLLNNSQFTSKQLFDIYNCVLNVCKRIDINLDSSKWTGTVSGLPYNIPFIIKHK